MQNTIQKTIAALVIAGLLASFAFNVNAAALTVDSVVYNGTTTINVTDAGVDYTADLITTLRVTDADGATVAGIDATDATEANGSFAVDVSAESVTLNAGGIFTLSFVTAGGNFASNVFVVGAANEVNVTANVLPILSMKITGGAVAFGDLVADVATTGSTPTTVTINTNAAAGYTLQVSNAGLKDGSNEIDAATTGENLSTGYGYGINATVSAGATIDTKSSAAATIDAAYDGVDNTDVSGLSLTPVNITTATGPVSAQATSVNYYTRISALQETGNYTDTITYSVTGSF